MEATVVQRPTEAKKAARIDVFRWQKWADGEGKLWIVTNTFGHDNAGRFGANVELLDVDSEATADFSRVDFEHMIRSGTLKRVEGPILM